MLNYLVKVYANLDAQVTPHKEYTPFSHTVRSAHFPTPSFVVDSEPDYGVRTGL